jgi:MarR family transcriptional regulator, organic hydroperoxide resistance regulator
VISEDELSDRPWALLALQRTTHRTLQALAASLAELELTAAEINTLANLADGRGRTVRQLGLDTGTRGTTLTGVLDRLERRGYLTREPNAADRRSFRIALTGSGQAVAERVREAVADLERTALAGLSPRQLAGYRAVLAALQEASR